MTNAERCALYYAANREALLEQKRLHRLANLEKERTKDLAYAEQHREARRLYAREYRRANPEKIAAKRRERLRAKGEKIRAQKRASNQRNRGNVKARNQRWQAANRSSINAKHRAQYAENPAVFLERVRRWIAKNPQKARNISQNHNERRRSVLLNVPVNDLTTEQWRTIKAHYGHHCVYCHRKMQRLTMDHVLPLSQGGSHTFSNVVPACPSCNSRKSDGPPPSPVQLLLVI